MALDFSDLAIIVSELPPTTWVDICFNIFVVVTAIFAFTWLLFDFIRKYRWQQDDDQYIP
ncbi:hypothetical protein [Acinetobacter seifertii]|uniref:hypothetical protein n=1 Tax=Acinetobacter seifertii TaxID=1530123 RepID=UPI00168CECF4|nr:hypothetical protein IC763_09980 [Acinetobacter seifertii]